MKIIGERHYIDIEHNGKTARFTGELCMNGFAAIASSMKWLPPHDNQAATDYERISLMKAVVKELKNNSNKVFFTNDQFEDIEI